MKIMKQQRELCWKPLSSMGHNNMGCVAKIGVVKLQHSVTSLHNWAVATYYRAQGDSTKLSDLIVAWSTAKELHLLLRDKPKF